MVEINFPLFPNRVYGVLNAIFLIILGFWFYYLGPDGNSGYSQIEQKYMDGVTIVKTNIVGDDPRNCIKVNLQIPKEVTHVIDRPIEITLTNTGDIDFEELQIWLGEDSFANAVSMKEGGVYFKSLARHSIVTGKIPLRAKPSGSPDEFSIEPVFYSSTRDTVPAKLILDTTPPQIKYDTTAALWNSLGEIILMPPWSNGILVLFILILSGFVEMIVHLIQKEIRKGAYNFMRDPRKKIRQGRDIFGKYSEKGRALAQKFSKKTTSQGSDESGKPRASSQDSKSDNDGLSCGEGGADTPQASNEKMKWNELPIWFRWAWGLSTWLVHLVFTYLVSRWVFGFLISKI